MLYEVNFGRYVELCDVNAVERMEDGNAIIYVCGNSFITDIRVDNMLEMVKAAKSELKKTTSDSKFAG